MSTKSSKSIVKIDNGTDYVEVYSKDKVDTLVSSISTPENRYLHDIQFRSSNNNDVDFYVQLTSNSVDEINTYDLFIDTIKALGEISTQDFLSLPCRGVFDSGEGIDERKGFIYSMNITDPKLFRGVADTNCEISVGYHRTDDGFYQYNNFIPDTLDTMLNSGFITMTDYVSLYGEYTKNLESTNAKRISALESDASSLKTKATTLETDTAVLKSQTSSLILRNNELSELVGKEMDYQFSEYSTQGKDTAIPSTIGERSVVSNDDTRGLVASIEGRTEYSRNILNLSDTTFDFSGVKGTCKDGVITINGKNSASNTIAVFLSYNVPLESTSYFIKIFGNMTSRATYYFDLTNDINRGISMMANNDDNPNIAFTLTDNQSQYKFLLKLLISPGVSINAIFRPMLVKGTVEPTMFVPYYSGLKSVENPKLKVYGKGSEYTDLKVGDKVNYLYLGGSSGTGQGEEMLILSLNSRTYSFYPMAGHWNAFGKEYNDNSLVSLDNLYDVTFVHSLAASNFGVKNATKVNPLLEKILTDSSNLTLAGVDSYHDEIKIIQKDNGLFRVELHTNFRIVSISKSLITYGQFRTGGASTGGEFGADNVILNPSGGSNYYIKSNSVQHFVCDILDPISPGDAYQGTKQGTALVGTDGAWIYVKGLNSADEYIEWLKSNPIKVGYPIAKPTITTLYDDLSLADVSFLQKAGYVITAENDNSSFNVNPKLNLKLVTKGVKA